MILQFSFPRSASTRAYNMVRLLGEEVVKSHHYNRKWRGLKSVCTVRPAAMMLASYYRVHPQMGPFDQKVLDELSRIYEKTAEDALQVTASTDALWLHRGESDWTERIARHIGKKVTQEVIDYIEHRCSKKVLAAIQRGLTSFSEWDSKTKIHGDHIAGKDWQEIIPESLHGAYASRCDDLDAMIFEATENTPDQQP